MCAMKFNCMENIAYVYIYNKVGVLKFAFGWLFVSLFLRKKSKQILVKSSSVWSKIVVTEEPIRHSLYEAQHSRSILCFEEDLVEDPSKKPTVYCPKQ